MSQSWAPALVAALLAAAVIAVPARVVDGPMRSRVPRWSAVTVAISRRWPRSSRHAVRDPAAVPDALALLALAYRSGLPTWQVLSSVGRLSPDQVGADLRQVAAALQWGATAAEAWASVDSSWAPAARAVAIAGAAGVAPGPMLLEAADDLRREEQERLEVAAARVGVRLVAPLGLVLLPAFCLTTVVPLVIALGRQLLAQT